MDFCLSCLLSLDMDGCAHTGFVYNSFLVLYLVFLVITAANNFHRDGCNSQLSSLSPSYIQINTN